MDLFEQIISSAPLKEAKVTEHTTITIKEADGTEKQVKNEERVLASRFTGRRPAYLSVKFVTNINLGNYQSARVEKSLMIPVGAEKDPELESQIKTTDAWACSLLEKLVEKDVQPILASLQKRQ